MKRYKKISAWICLLSLFLLVGCGKKETNDKKTIEVFNSKSENQEIMKELIAEFEKEYPDINVVFTSPPDAGTVLRTRLVKNTIPNIIAYGGDNTYTELANVGMLEDLSNTTLEDDILPAYKNMTKALQEDDEKLFGVPYATNAAGVIYNVDLFNEHNQKIPTTWEEFIQVCNYFKSHDITPIEGTFKDSWTILSIFNPLAGILTDKDFMIERKSNETTFVKGWQEPMNQLVEVLDYTQRDSMGTSYADGVQAFAKGKSAMIINGTWAIPEITKANSDLAINIFPLPASDNSDDNYVTSGIDVMLTIGKGTDNIDESKKFIEFMKEKNNAERYINNQFAFSAIEGVNQKDEKLSGISSEIESGKVNDFIDHFMPNGYDLGALLSEFILNEESKPNNSKENIDKSLKKMDESYDVYNFE